MRVVALLVLVALFAVSVAGAGCNRKHDIHESVLDKWYKEQAYDRLVEFYTVHYVSGPLLAEVTACRDELRWELKTGNWTRVVDFLDQLFYGHVRGPI